MMLRNSISAKSGRFLQHFHKHKNISKPPTLQHHVNFTTPVQPLQQQPQAALAPGQREYEATKRKYEEVLEPFIRPNSTMERMASFPAQKLAQTGKFKEASDCLDASLVAFSAPDEGSGSEGEDDGSPPPSK